MKHVMLFEQFIKEAEGKKASGFLTKLGNDVEHETVASMQAQDEVPSKEIMAAMKKLKVDAEDCVVIGDYHTDDWNRVLKIAKSSGVKFIEVEDENGSAIVFSLIESRQVNAGKGEKILYSKSAGPSVPSVSTRKAFSTKLWDDNVLSNRKEIAREAGLNISVANKSWSELSSSERSSLSKYFNVKEAENMLNEAFAEGEFVRWSNPKGQSGTSALYGVVAKDRGSKVDLTILATSGKDDTQPTQRYSNWSGGGNIPYEGGYSKEDLQGIIDREGVRSGSGYEKKYLTAWEPA